MKYYLQKEFFGELIIYQHKLTMIVNIYRDRTQYFDITF